MQNFENLNHVIKIIEEHLHEEIDYKELAKIIGFSEYTFHRIFSFVFGINASEYIKKRRLSTAAMELQTTSLRIIDIAIKYGYTSPVSFARAFKQMHGASPDEVKKSNVILNIFPPLEINPVLLHNNELLYRIEHREEMALYGITTGEILKIDKASITMLWNQCYEDGTRKKIIEYSQNIQAKELYYGVTKYLDDTQGYIKYYILGRKSEENFKKIIIPKSKWLVFRCNTKEQTDIINLLNKIHTSWLPLHKEYVNKPLDLEIYYQNYCEYCIAID